MEEIFLKTEHSDRSGEFKIEQYYIHGWDDAGWIDGDDPVRFNSRAEAEAALDEFFAEQQEHVDGGDIAEDAKYDRGDFRVVEVAIGDREKRKWKHFEILRDFIMLHSDDATEEGYVRLCSDAAKALDELEDDDCACIKKDQHCK